MKKGSMKRYQSGQFLKDKIFNAASKSNLSSGDSNFRKAVPPGITITKHSRKANI